MDLESAQNNTVTKLPLLKQEKVDGTSTSTISDPVIIKEKAKKKNDVKARNMMLMALPNEHLLTFSQYKIPRLCLKSYKQDSMKIVSQLAILGENISQEDLNMKFLRSLPAEWNTHVGFWRNKPDLETMSFDDLYNNTNEVDTASIQVSAASTLVSNVSAYDNTANMSDATAYAFLANQPNGCQLVYKDLEQIHKDDLKEMDLKWQLALLSMRARRYFQRTGKKITINRSDTAGLRNQDSSRKTMIMEDTTSKAMVAIDGAGFDWSYMADDEVPTNMALMALLDSK
nr:hypothetical protein [Tanacetum cinerariifolium]